MQKHSDENVLECLGSSERFNMALEKELGGSVVGGEVDKGQCCIVDQEFGVFLIVNTGSEDILSWRVAWSDLLWKNKCCLQMGAGPGGTEEGDPVGGSCHVLGVG